LPGIEELNQKYKDRDVAFFVVYSKEPHAGERRYFKKYTQHSTYEHKLGYAKELVETFGMKVPVLVDDLEESVVMAYGRMPKKSPGSSRCWMNFSPSREPRWRRAPSFFTR